MTGGNDPASQSELWFSAVGGRLTDEFPDFFDVESMPWAKAVEAEWMTIRDEIMTFVAAHEKRVHPYFNRRLVSRPRAWLTASLLFWGLPLKHNQRQCRQTMEILSSIPGLVSASVSMLEPGAEIHSHRGDTNAICRCHLPLVVPAGLPECGFRANRSTRSWEEGELLVFCDAVRHSAWNRTDQRRVLLLFDVLRPEFIGQGRTVSAVVLSSLAMQYLEQVLPLLNRLSVANKSRLRHGIARILGIVLRAVGS